MTKDAFMEQMDLILDGVQISFDSKLEDIEEWDSIAAVSFLSLMSTNGKTISMSSIGQVETIADLYRLANGEE